MNALGTNTAMATSKRHGDETAKFIAKTITAIEHIRSRYTQAERAAIFLLPSILQFDTTLTNTRT